MLFSYIDVPIFSKEKSMNKRVSDFENLIKKDYGNIAGIVVLHGGAKIYESYFNGYTDDNTLYIASVTKSIVSSLIGVAADKGYIKNINQKVLEFFPDYDVSILYRYLKINRLYMIRTLFKNH